MFWSRLRSFFRGLSSHVRVAAAYGWEWPLGEDEVFSRLLVLNLERAKEFGAELVGPGVCLVGLAVE